MSVRLATLEAAPAAGDKLIADARGCSCPQPVQRQSHVIAVAIDVIIEAQLLGVCEPRIDPAESTC
jgi:hypothetical protein